VASSGGSILERIFQVFAHSARLTLLHLPGGNRLPNWVTVLTPTRMAVNDAAIGDDHVTRSRMWHVKVGGWRVLPAVPLDPCHNLIGPLVYAA
jgi:hypothetical protein